MADKNLKTRIVHKHDIEANWLKATNFTPMKGEIIVYDIDENYSYERFKIGDGATLVSQLQFFGDNFQDLIDANKDKIDELEIAIDKKSDEDHEHDDYVITSRTVNGKPLSSDIALSASDLNIYVQDTEPSNAVIGAIWIDTSSTMQAAEGVKF